MVVDAVVKKHPVVTRLRLFDLSLADVRSISEIISQIILHSKLLLLMVLFYLFKQCYAVLKEILHSKLTFQIDVSNRVGFLAFRRFTQIQFSLK